MLAPNAGLAEGAGLLPMRSKMLLSPPFRLLALLLPPFLDPFGKLPGFLGPWGTLSNRGR